MIDDLFDLSGKIACVTGASAGLGEYVARFLAQCGVAVVGVARRGDRLQQWQQASGGRTAAVVADLSDTATVPEVARQVCAVFGPPDILINAAGINTRQSAGKVTPQGWAVTLDLNLTTPFFLAQTFAGAMQDKGWGRIINFASLQTFRAFPGGIAYGASKDGVGQLTRAMAEAWSRNGINANAIGPGFFPTELTKAVFEDHERSVRNAKQTFIGRNGNLKDLDGPLLSLCSEASRYVTGQILMVDGGFTPK